jgi:hypothetical protein
MNIKRDPTGSGQWLLRNGNQVISYATAGEARRAMSRIAMVQAIVRCVQSLATATDTGADLWQEYWDRGAPSADELAQAGITQEQLVACINLLENFNKFMNNQAVTQDAYRVTLNQVRRVAS